MKVRGWGEGDAGDVGEAVITAEIDTDEVAEARGKVPNLKNIRPFALEEHQVMQASAEKA